MINKIKHFWQEGKYEVKAWWLIFKDNRTPLLAKLILLACLIYVLTPIDLIPDLLEGIGEIDDMIVVFIGILIVLKMIPKSIVQDCRLRARYK